MPNRPADQDANSRCKISAGVLFDREKRVLLSRTEKSAVNEIVQRLACAGGTALVPLEAPGGDRAVTRPKGRSAGWPAESSPDPSWGAGAFAPVVVR